MRRALLLLRPRMTDVARTVTFRPPHYAVAGATGSLRPHRLGNALPIARHRTLAVASMLAALVGTAVVTAGPSGAQEEPAAETDQVRDRQSMVAVDFDVLRAEGGVVTTTIGDLADNVQAQKELLMAAEWAYSSAQSELAAAEAAVADTQNRLNEIILQADAVVIDVFINPPTDTALDALTAASLEDATIKQSILNLQADHDAELLDEYESAMEQLEIEKATKSRPPRPPRPPRSRRRPRTPTSRRPPGSRPPSPSRSSAGSTIAWPRPTCSRTSTPPWPSRSGPRGRGGRGPQLLDEEILAERA